MSVLALKFHPLASSYHVLICLNSHIRYEKATVSLLNGVYLILEVQFYLKERVNID